MGPGDLESSYGCCVTRSWVTVGYGRSRSNNPLLEGPCWPGLSRNVVPNVRSGGNGFVPPLPRVDHPRPYFSTATRSDALAFLVSDVVEWRGSVLWIFGERSGSRLRSRNYGCVFVPVLWSIHQLLLRIGDL
jgi:hypothetical protein